jgi:hypothetical protein
MNKYLLFFVLTLAIQLGSAQKCSHQHGLYKTSHVSRLDTMDIVHQQIRLDVSDFSGGILKGDSEMEIAMHVATNQFRLDLQGLVVDSVWVDGVMVNFLQGTDGFWVNSTMQWSPFDTLTCRVKYHGDPIVDATWGGFYWNSQYAYNMGVGFGADPHCFGRVWHPCIDDFNDRVLYDLFVETQFSHRAYCGGVLQEEVLLDNGHRMFHWHLSQPVPSYLASVAVAAYVHVEDEMTSNDGTSLPIWLAAKSTDTTNFKNSLIHLPEVVSAYEDHFGPYPFDRVGYVAVPFNGGAMEHASNIAYPIFAINGNLTYETLYAHELSHMWWGDAVTCATEEDMWLNEGWASYCESLTLEALYGAAAYRAEQDALHREVLTSAHVTDLGFYPVSGVPHSLTYGTTVYRKGAWVVHSLRGIMGDNSFFQACRDYQSQHAFQSHNSIQLRDFFQNYTARNLTAFFDTYVFQPGFSEFRIIGYASVGADAPGYFWTQVNIENHLHRQSSYCAEMPLEIGFKKADGTWEFVDFVQDEQFQAHDFLLNFIPTDVVLNPKETIHQSVLSQEKWMGQVGTHDLTYAELTLNLEAMGGQDSIWVRVENHFAEANYTHSIPGTDWVLSGDRMYEVHLSDTASVLISAKMKFQANNAARYDTLLFADLQAAGFNEDSLHLMYRPLTGGDWELYPFATVNTMGSATNGNGRFDISFLKPGQYTFGFHSGSVGFQENGNLRGAEALFALQGHSIEAKCFLDELSVYAMDGQLIHRYQNISKGEKVDCTSLGSVLIKARSGKKEQVQKIIIH